MTASHEYGVAAVVLGAAEWPHYSTLTASAAFTRSAQRFTNYLLRPQPRGMGVTGRNLLNLFGDPRSPADLTACIADFLTWVSSGRGVTDVVIYYTGHGSFTEERRYFLAIRSTRKGFAEETGLRLRSLARTVQRSAPNLRHILILDCCFAAAAAAEMMQADAISVMAESMYDVMPEQGSALLCACSARDIAIARNNEAYTMFSGALLDVLEQGDRKGGERLTIAEVGRLTTAQIRNRWKDDSVRPEVHYPDQSRGTLAALPLFPNPAFSPDSPVQMSSPQDRLDIHAEPAGPSKWYRRPRLISIGVILGSVAALGAGLYEGVSLLHMNESTVAISNKPPSPVSHQAVALAWNRAGLWVARSGATLNQASSSALEECNRSFGRCEIAPLMLDPARPSCLAVAGNEQGHLEIALGPEEQRAGHSALNKCEAAKTGDCQIAYSSCN